jgi:hypothetical protein
VTAKPRQLNPPNVGTPASTIPMGLRVLAIVLRALFMGAFAVVVVRVSSPQSETIWSVYETPGDLIRLALGFAVYLWIVIDLGLPRPCGRPARIGHRHRHLVTCARNTRVSL